MDLIHFKNSGGKSCPKGCICDERGTDKPKKKSFCLKNDKFVLTNTFFRRDGIKSKRLVRLLTS